MKDSLNKFDFTEPVGYLQTFLHSQNKTLTNRLKYNVRQSHSKNTVKWLETNQNFK